MGNRILYDIKTDMINKLFSIAKLRKGPNRYSF